MNQIDKHIDKSSSNHQTRGINIHYKRAAHMLGDLHGQPPASLGPVALEELTIAEEAGSTT